MHYWRRQENFVPAIIYTPLRSSSGSSGLIYCKTFVHPPTLFLNVLVKHFSKGVFGLLTSSMHTLCSQLYYNFHRFKRYAARRLMQAFFSAAPKKTQGEKTQEFRNSSKKNSNSSKKIHLLAFLWNFFKRSVKDM